MSPVKVLEVVCEGDDVMDGHLGLHDVDLLLARGRQQVDLLHPRLVNTVKKGYRRIYESICRQNYTYSKGYYSPKYKACRCLRYSSVFLYSASSVPRFLTTFDTILWLSDLSLKTCVLH